MGGSNSSQTRGDDAISTSMAGRRRNLQSGGDDERWGWLLYNCVQLSWKGLGGRISEKIGQQQALRRLSLHDNELVGAVPTSLGFLRNLRGVYLFNNRLSGSIPAAIDSTEKLQNLIVLNVSSNRFKGQIPDTVGNITSVTNLDLSENHTIGEIPTSLSFPIYQTFLPSISFGGNLELCGYSSSTPCPSPPTESNNQPSQGAAKHHRRKLSTKDIILIAAGALLVVLLILCCVLLCCLIGKKAGSKTKTVKQGRQRPRLAEELRLSRLQGLKWSQGLILGENWYTLMALLCSLLMICCISEKGHVKPANYLDAHEKFLLGVATKGDNFVCLFGYFSLFYEKIVEKGHMKLANYLDAHENDMLVHLAREKYENNLRIPKSLEKVSVLFADWYNICETSDHFFRRIMELSVSNCVSSEEMKPQSHSQSHQGQQISFLLLLRIKDRVNSPFCPSLFKKMPEEKRASFNPRKRFSGLDSQPSLHALSTVHFLYKGTHTRALLAWELFYFAMSQICYDHYWLRLDFQKICMILYLLILLLVALLIFGSWLGFWFVRKLLLTDDGSIDSGASHFVSWSIRIVASVLILQVFTFYELII
ncbi:hypothetical protein ACS0TY_010443 [Phlomoides rotata]